MNTRSSAATAAAHGWTQALAALVLLWTALVLAGHETLGAMVGIWMRSDTFAHAFTVPPLALWLAWRQRARLVALTPRAAPWLLPALAAALFVWLLGVLAVANSVSQLALVSALVLAVPAVLGLRVARQLLFPLGFLFFAVPVGEFLMPQLMAWTADFTVFALRVSGIPVVRDGLQFVIPSGEWSVEAACSGLRYLIASFMVGVLFAYLNYRSPWRRAVFVAASLVVPIVANWVRAYLIVMLGHFSNNTIATGVDHLVYGWLFFGVVIMVLFVIGLRWAETEPESGPALAHVVAALTPAARRGIWGAALAGAGLALAGQVWIHKVQAVEEGSGPPRLQALLEPGPGWTYADAPVAAWQHGFQKPAAEFEGRYARGAQRVGLDVVYYARQHQDSKLVSSENRLVAPKDAPWRAGPTERRELTLNGMRLQVRSTPLRAILTPPGTRTEGLLVWQVYWVNGTLTSSDESAKLLGAWNLLTGRGDDAAAILVYAPVHGSSDDAAAVLEGFLREHCNALLQQLQRVRDVRHSTINDNRPF